MSPKDCAYIVERLAVRFMSMVAEYERKLLEHRDAFGVRTSADAKIIDGMRAEVEDLRSRLNALGIQAAKQAGEALGMVEGEGLLGAARRVVKERDGLMVQVQDQRAEIERLREEIAEELNQSLPNPTPKRHPVKVGEWVKRTTRPYEDTPIGSIGQVAIVNTAMNSYRLDSGQRWSFEYCEPCDPPADHDTPAGKKAAEAVIRDFRSGDAAFSPIEIKGALFDDKTVIVSREPDSEHGSRIVITDKDDMGEANIYLTESGARQMATALIGLCDVRKVPQ